MSRSYPLNCWYVAGLSGELGPGLRSTTVAGTPVVLWRTADGHAVALEDRCAHRGYPLSHGHVDGTGIVCGYHGFCFDTEGTCTRVPSQDNPPYGAGVRAYPVRDDGVLVWVWMGEAGQARLPAPPRLPWLTGDAWRISGAPVVIDVAANYLLLHDHYLDLTHIPSLHPEMLPPGLQQLSRIDEVRVTEMSVSLRRTLPPAPLAGWESFVTGLEASGDLARTHHGEFVSPAVVVEGWSVDPGEGDAYELARVQALTPIDEGRTRMYWHVTRNFALDDAELGERLHKVLGMLMRDDILVVEEVQRRVGDRASTGLRVSADAAMLKARQIVSSMVRSEESAAPAPSGRGPVR